MADYTDTTSNPPLKTRVPRQRNPVEAFTITDLIDRGPIGRTMLYAEIRSGRLPARTRCGRTFVLASDWLAWLETAPVMQFVPIATPVAPRRGRGRPRKLQAAT